MNLQRIHELYESPAPLSVSDADSLKQLCKDYPFYSKPYVLLARHYYLTEHYKFEETLRQAAMRVKDRRELYAYIHGKSVTDKVQAVQAEMPAGIPTPEVEVSQHVDADEGMSAEQLSKPGIVDFLETEPDIEIPSETAVPDQINSDISDEGFIETLQAVENAHPETHVHAAKPVEFEFAGSHFDILPDAEEEDHDIIGEEITTEFSFSRHFEPFQENLHQEVDSVSEVTDTESDKALPFSDSKQPETAVQTEQPDLTLRKYPVYSVEAFIGSSSDEDGNASEPAIKSESKDPSDAVGMDFLSWLSHPKSENTASENESVNIEAGAHLNLKTDLKGGDETVENPDVNAGETDEMPSSRTLDLIERFIQVNPQISRPKKEFFNAENMAKRSEVLDLEFVTETLAQIYYDQGNFEMALKAYEKLSLQNPSKQAYFASLIEKIKSERK